MYMFEELTAQPCEEYHSHSIRIKVNDAVVDVGMADYGDVSAGPVGRYFTPPPPPPPSLPVPISICTTRPSLPYLYQSISLPPVPLFLTCTSQYLYHPSLSSLPVPVNISTTRPSLPYLYQSVSLPPIPPFLTCTSLYVYHLSLPSLPVPVSISTTRPSLPYLYQSIPLPPTPCIPIPVSISTPASSFLPYQYQSVSLPSVPSSFTCLVDVSLPSTHPSPTTITTSPIACRL